jgi:hypothetical protein
MMPAALVRDVGEWVCSSVVAAFLLFAFLVNTVHAEEEVALFDRTGKAIAYIAVDDELIYLLSGKPVAYLETDSQGGYAVYGFNGQHLGWFVKGAIWDQAEAASCPTKELLNSTGFEPFKAFKEFKPFKAFTQFAPFRPALSNAFGYTPCSFLLAAGGAS